MSCVFITGKTNAKAAKIFLEKEGLYDRERKMTKISEEEVMIPIKEELGKQIRCKEIHGADKSSDFVIPVEGKIQHIDSQNVNQLKISPKVKLKIAIEHMLQEKGVTFNDTLHQDVCRHWEKHDDLVLLPEKSFTLDEWKQFGVDLWKLVAETLGVRRLAKKSAISSDGFRTPNVSLLYGDNGWITHVDNGIKYTFDVTKCMFSAGNISEKIRIGHFDCKGQTVVDLYAGIGYFVLPYIIHAKADMVYACEWNDNAIDALKKNLELNGVTEHCVIYEGDNKKFPLQAVADHVNLGLIPSSEPGWPVACAALRSDSGGWLHVHGNVTSGICGNEEVDAAILPSKTSLQTNFKPSVKSSQLCLHDQAHVSKPTSTLMSSKCDERSSISSNMEQIPSSNKKIKPEWLDWACYVAESLLWHLTKSHENRNWNVHIQHIEHVKSYAPHIDHLVLDVECRPSQL